MKNLKDRLLSHLSTLSGEHPDMVTVDVSALPLFLRERYEVYLARLFGRKYALAVERGIRAPVSPGDYAKHLATLRANLGVPIALVVPTLPSYARNRMVQMGLPFVVPGTQFFLPDSVIDLREYFPRSQLKNRERLSPAAQCTVLYHLLRAPLNGISLKEISMKVGYSQMMLTKVKDELVAAGIGKILRNGRSRPLEFTAHARLLWDLALPHLNSPVKRTHWVRWTGTKQQGLPSGMTALSRLTNIADDRLPTLAITLAAFEDCRQQGELTGCEDADLATAKVEIWSYPPELLADGVTVDSLSLYLSLRNSPDERVQQQLELLIKGIKWSKALNFFANTSRNSKILTR